MSALDRLSNGLLALASASAIVKALLYGALQTGFTKELLFRGLIAGSLSRRLPMVWANIGQALLFLVVRESAKTRSKEMARRAENARRRDLEESYHGLKKRMPTSFQRGSG